MMLKLFLFIGGVITLCSGDAVNDMKCNCSVHHPQQMFCDADFAFVGTVVSIKKEYIKPSFVYSIDISDDMIYKGRSDFFTEGEPSVSVHTPFGPNLCGVTNLEIDKEYIITGNYVDQRLAMTFCNWVQDLDNVTDQQMSFLKDGGYLAQCNSCSIVSAKSEWKNQNSTPPWTRSGCYFNPAGSLLYGRVDCEAAYSNCYLKTDNPPECWWRNTTEYNKCYERRETKWLTEKAQAAYTTHKDCRNLETKWMKRKCLKLVKEHMEGTKQDLEPQAISKKLLDHRSVSVDYWW